MPTLDELMTRAMQRVTSVADDPEKRYALRAAFYDEYGADDLGLLPGQAGYGNSELAFMRWEIERGVLAPAPHGSPWWRAVNSSLIFDAELARLIHESGRGLQAPLSSQRWLDYMDNPDEGTWYRAHNGSIASGYLAQTVAARAELDGEQRFMNIVLYRVLYAQAMVSGATFLGRLGELLGNPALPAVRLITDVSDFYPRHYPLTREDVRKLMGRGDGIMDLAVRLFDDGIILPEATHVYGHCATSLNLPELGHLVRDGKPIYPAL
jgi:hypothetical protein